MNVDVISVTADKIKRAVIKLFNLVNGTHSNPELPQLSFERLGDDKVILQNPDTGSGVVINKIPISSIFPQIVSVREFKAGITSNAPIISNEHVDRFNLRHERVIVGAEVDVFKYQTPVSTETAKDFLLFCRVFGFYELDIGDVSLISEEGKLIISVNSTNKLFTGYLEVLV